MGFDNISVYWWRKQEHLEKTIDLPAEKYTGQWNGRT
jgi:hypothetical protein